MTSSDKKRHFPKGDILLFTAIPCIAVILSLLFSSVFARGGEKVILRYEKGEMALSLAEDTDLEIVSRGIRLRIVVEDGAAWIAESECPDKICVRTGKIGPGYASFAACLPAGVVLTLSGEGGVPDAIAY